MLHIGVPGMNQRKLLLLVLAIAIGWNYVVAVVNTSFQPLRVSNDKPSARKSDVKARLIDAYPRVTDSLEEIEVFEATTGLGRRVVGAVGFDDSRYIAAPPTDDDWVRFRYGTQSVGSRLAEAYGIHEQRDYIPIIKADVLSGWPFPALSCSLTSDQRFEATIYDAIHANAVPYRPIFPGFAINTLVHCFLIYTLAVPVALLARRAHSSASAQSDIAD